MLNRFAKGVRFPKTKAGQSAGGEALPALMAIDSTSDALLKSAQAQYMVADKDYNIIYLNPTVMEFLRKHEKAIQTDLPAFSVDTLVGANIDIFHKDPSHQRKLLDSLTAPFYTSIRVGGQLFNLCATPIFHNEERTGTMVEWKSGQEMENSAKTEAISRSMAVIEFDLDGNIETANQNFLDTVGYSLEEIQGKHHSIFVGSDYAQTPEYREFWGKIKSNEFFVGEYRRFGKDGREIWLQASYNPQVDAKGTPFKAVKFASDITDKVHARRAAAEITADVAARVQNAAAGSEEMLASINDINTNMVSAQESVQQILHMASDGAEHSEKLREGTQAMEGVVNLIRDISDQVKLLALNATIEAARAGQAGKSFAVVAAEVKSLATQVAEATQKVSEEIQGIQGLSQKVAQANSDIAGACAGVDESFTSVAAAIEEQSAVTNETSTNMQEVAALIEELDEQVKRAAGIA